MSGHTPGPWASETWAHERGVRLTGRDVRRIRPAGGPAIAYLPEGRADIMEANAHLIAAAPEMLEALEGLLGPLATIPMADYDMDESLPEKANLRVSSAAIQRARAAIRKATGAPR